jgi:hypothetical protein
MSVVATTLIMAVVLNSLIQFHGLETDWFDFPVRTILLNGQTLRQKLLWCFVLERIILQQVDI